MAWQSQFHGGAGDGAALVRRLWGCVKRMDSKMSGEVLMNAGEGGVVHVTLRHTGRLNAMSRPMWRQLRAVFEDVQRRTDARCVVIAGEGGAFCAGGDISEYPGFRFDAAALRDFHENDVWGGLNAMLACDVPIVASISGACMGAGVEIASCCDVRVAGAAARFGAPIAKLGFPMAPREAQLVAAAVGETAARQMLLEAATFTAADMLARGFLSRVVPDDDVPAEALASATVRDVGDEGARLLLEQLARQVVRRACAGRAVVELGRVLLHMVEELLEVGRGRLGVDHQHLRHLGQQGQGDEVFLDVVIELGVHGGGNGMVHAAHKQGVAIGRRAGRKAGAHGAARAAAVVNHQRFTGGFGELRGQGARKGIGAPTGRKRHHQVHRLGGPGRCLRPHAARAQQAQASTCGGSQHVAALHHVFCCHSLSPVVVIKKEVRPWRSL